MNDVWTSSKNDVWTSLKFERDQRSLIVLRNNGMTDFYRNYRVTEVELTLINLNDLTGNRKRRHKVILRHGG